MLNIYCHIFIAKNFMINVIFQMHILISPYTFKLLQKELIKLYTLQISLWFATEFQLAENTNILLHMRFSAVIVLFCFSNFRISHLKRQIFFPGLNSDFLISSITQSPTYIFLCGKSLFFNVMLNAIYLVLSSYLFLNIGLIFQAVLLI